MIPGERAKSALALCALVLASQAIAHSLDLQLAPEHGWPVRLALHGAILAVLLGATTLFSERGALADGARRVWPAAIPLLALPLVPAPWLLGGLGAVLAGFAPTGNEQRSWRRALGVLAIAIGVVYLVIGARAGGPADNDAAYYLGVARHLAKTHRFEEPIVWHYLTPPPALLHAPFDYWQGLTSLILAPVWRHATLAMAALSALSVLAFWRLGCRALRRPAVQLLALLLFAFSPAMAIYRFDTEAVVPAQLALLGAALALESRRFRLAVALGFLLLPTRADGLLWWAFLVAAVALAAGAKRRGVLATAATGLAGWIGYQLLVFGTPLPPAARLGPFLSHYDDLFAYGIHIQPRLGSLFRPDVLFDQLVAALDCIRKVPFVPRGGLWAMVVLAGCVLAVRRREPLDLLFLALLGAAIPVACFSPILFAPYRTLHLLLPIVVLVGAGALDRAVEALPAGDRRIGAVAAGIVFAACWVIARPLAVYRDRPDPLAPLARDLRALDATLDGQPVATARPCLAIAHTRSPAIAIPSNGEAAVEAALRRYGVRWLLLGGDAMDFTGESRPLLRALRDGRRRAIGALAVRPAVTLPDGTVLLRVDPRE